MTMINKTINSRKIWNYIQAIIIVCILFILLFYVDPVFRKDRDDFISSPIDQSLQIDNDDPDATTISPIKNVYLCHYHGMKWETTIQHLDKSPEKAVLEVEKMQSLTLKEEDAITNMSIVKSPFFQMALGSRKAYVNKDIPMVTKLLSKTTSTTVSPWGIIFAFPQEDGSSIVTSMRLLDDVSLFKLLEPVNTSILAKELNNEITMPSFSIPIDKIENETKRYRLTTYFLKNSADVRSVQAFYSKINDISSTVQESGLNIVLQRLALTEKTIMLYHSLTSEEGTSLSIIKIWKKLKNNPKHGDG